MVAASGAPGHLASRGAGALGPFSGKSQPIRAECSSCVTLFPELVRHLDLLHRAVGNLNRIIEHRPLAPAFARLSAHPADELLAHFELEWGSREVTSIDSPCGKSAWNLWQVCKDPIKSPTLHLCAQNGRTTRGWLPAHLRFVTELRTGSDNEGLHGGRS